MFRLDIKKLQDTYMPRALAVLSLVLSYVLTANYALSLGLGAPAVALGIGTCWEGSKYLFSLKGWQLLKSPLTGHKLAGAALCASVGVLIAGSVLASYSGLNAIKTGAEHAEAKESDAVLARQELAVGLRADIERLEGRATKYQSANFLTAAREIENRIEVKRDELFRLVSNKSQHVAAMRIRVDTNQNTSNTIMVIASLMLELISIASITLLLIPSVPMSRQERDKYGATVLAIKSGEIKPSIRALVASGLKQSDAQAVMSRAESLGVITKRGRGWATT